MEEENDDAEALPLVARHLVLKVGFILKSKAFMLTHHSQTFTFETWQPYKAWAKAFSKTHGANKCEALQGKVLEEPRRLSALRAAVTECVCLFKIIKRLLGPTGSLRFPEFCRPENTRIVKKPCRITPDHLRIT